MTSSSISPWLIRALVCTINGIVVARPDQNSEQDLVWDFHNNVRDDERRPRVSLGWPFPNLVQRTLSDKLGHYPEG